MLKDSSSKNRSSVITSSQNDIHPRLDEVVKRHLKTTWRGGLHQPSVAVFHLLEQILGAADKAAIIFDSGCGTGESTRNIARFFPHCLVIGIDRSEKRLGRLCGDNWPTDSDLWRENNAIWVRAELATFWRLALTANWRLYKHFLLYPNPYPKPGQLKRRWHAHPVFPVLLELGGELELRSNWLIYMNEFSRALNIASGLSAQVTATGESEVSSPFEKKYRLRGQELHKLNIELGREAMLLPNESVIER
jgi:tRNA (guanine-N7-)-methyltransferase